MLQSDYYGDISQISGDTARKSAPLSFQITCEDNYRDNYLSFPMISKTSYNHSITDSLSLVLILKGIFHVETRSDFQRE